MLLALPGALLAQRTVAVHVPPGDVVAFASKGRSNEPPVDPVAPKEGVASVPVGEGQDRIYAWDRAINRLTSAPIAGSEWSPKVTELKDLAQVVVELRRNDEPVAAANVTLDDGRRKQDRLLDPSMKGDVTFFDVKPGSLKITVRYRAAGKDAAPVTQIFDAPAKGEAPPHFTVSLPEAVETLKPAAPTPKTGAAEAGTAAPAPSGGGINFVGTLFALVVGGGVAAAAWYFIKKNPGTVGETLERLGAQIPKPGDAPLADPPVAPAPAPAAPKPPEKIVLDTMPDPIQMAVPAAVSVSEPSLVSEAGVPIPLAEGETTVGREVGLGLSLAGESTVSRRHATIVRQGGTVTVQDSGSTNGTFVNGTPATSATTLRPGDSVQFGSVRFRYEA